MARLRISREENSGRSCDSSGTAASGAACRCSSISVSVRPAPSTIASGVTAKARSSGSAASEMTTRMAIALLGDADHDVGAAGDQRRVRARRQAAEADRRGWSGARTARRRARCRRGVARRHGRGELGQPWIVGRPAPAASRATSANRPVAGAAAQVAADRLGIEAVASGPVVLAEQADDEAGRAVAALRAAGADHRLLDRMQPAVAGRHPRR